MSKIEYRGRVLDVEEFSIVEIDKYIEDISHSKKYIDDIKVFSMPNKFRRYGFGLSSGSLYKWDTGDIFIKTSGLFNEDNLYEDYSALNESYIYNTFGGIGLEIASAFPIVVVFQDDEYVHRELTGCVSRKFKGNLVYYRDMRRCFNKNSGLFGKTELEQLFDSNPECMQGMINMCILDILTYQEDRHSKNFGILDNTFAPVYDNGASYGYNRLRIGEPENARFKAFGKRYVDVLEELRAISRMSVTLDIFNVNIKAPELFHGLIKENKLRAMESYTTRALKFIKEEVL
jgi:hypothetical protein